MGGTLWIKKTQRIIPMSDRGDFNEDDDDDSQDSNIKNTIKSGISFGCCLAIVISFVSWKSVGWAIFHGLLSWVYVIYYVITYTGFNDVLEQAFIK